VKGINPQLIIIDEVANMTDTWNAIKLTTPEGYSMVFSVEYVQALIQHNGGLPDGWKHEYVMVNDE
jgi:hypothetical protein